MNTPRLFILVSIAALAVALAVYVAADSKTPASTEPAPQRSNVAADGVGRRATDTPFDLRERDRLAQETPAPPPQPASDPPAATAPAPVDPERLAAPEGPPPTAVGPPGSPTIEAAIAAATAAAQEEVASIRSELRRKCWDSIDRGGVGDDGVEIVFSLGFDAEGHVITSAVQQSRETYIQGLDTCLGPFAHGLEVPAPGEPVSISVALTLP